MSTRTLLPLTVVFALSSATALGVAISPVVPGASAPAPAGGSCQAPVAAPVAPRPRPELEGCREAAAAPAPAGARSKLFHHLRYHQSFPASRGSVLNAMRASGEAGAAELAWLEGQLAPGSYASGAEVMRAVFPVAPAYVVLALQQ
jgi:hypothetical protein